MKIKSIFLVILNSIIAVSFGFGVLVFYKAGKPFIGGYYCNDQSINKPFFESTISTNETIIVATILSAACYILVETWKLVKKSTDVKKGKVYFIRCLTVSKLNKNKLFTNVFILMGLFCFGGGLTMFITDIGKYTVGRLRPNYFAICKPDWSRINCTDAFGRDNYIVGDDFCTANIGKRKLKDAHLSFPSGHSSFSAFSATYLILYLEINLQLKNALLYYPKVLFQTVIAILAVYCGLTRIANNKHHPTDVIVGFLLGVLIAFIVVQYLLKPLFRESDVERNCSEEALETPLEKNDAGHDESV